MSKALQRLPAPLNNYIVWSFIVPLGTRAYHATRPALRPLVGPVTLAVLAV